MNTLAHEGDVAIGEWLHDFDSIPALQLSPVDPGLSLRIWKPIPGRSGFPRGSGRGVPAHATHRVVTGWPGMVEALREAERLPLRDRKNEHPPIGLFDAPEGFRSNGDVRARTALHVDLDHGVTEDAVERLVDVLDAMGLAALVQRRDRADGTIKARAVVPLVPYAGHEGFHGRALAFFQLLEGLIGCELDHATATYSQPLFPYGPVQEGGRLHPRTVAVLDGAALDLQSITATASRAARKQAVRAKLQVERSEDCAAAQAAAVALLEAAGATCRREGSDVRSDLPRCAWPRDDYGTGPRDVQVTPDGEIVCYRSEGRDGLHAALQREAGAQYHAWRNSPARRELRRREQAWLQEVTRGLDGPATGDPQDVLEHALDRSRDGERMVIAPPCGFGKSTTAVTMGVNAAADGIAVYIGTKTHAAADGMGAGPGGDHARRSGVALIRIRGTGEDGICANEHAKARLAVIDNAPTPRQAGECFTCEQRAECLDRQGWGEVERLWEEGTGFVAIGTQAQIGKWAGLPDKFPTTPRRTWTIADENVPALLRLEIDPADLAMTREWGGEWFEQGNPPPLYRTLSANACPQLALRVWRTWTAVHEAAKRGAKWHEVHGKRVALFRNPALVVDAILSATPDALTVEAYGPQPIGPHVPDQCEVERVWIDTHASSAQTFNRDPGRWERGFRAEVLPRIQLMERPLVGVDGLRQAEVARELLGPDVPVVYQGAVEGVNDYQRCDGIVIFGSLWPRVDDLEVEVSGTHLSAADVGRLRAAGNLAQALGRLRVKAPHRAALGAPERVSMTVIGHTLPMGWDREDYRMEDARSAEGGADALEAAIIKLGSAVAVAGALGVSAAVVRKWKGRKVPAKWIPRIREVSGLYVTKAHRET